MNDAILSLDRPMYCQAREYADWHDVTDLEQLARIRLSMCYTAFREEMRPWNDMLVKTRPIMCSVNHDEPLPDAYVALQAHVNEIAILAAQRYGLDLSPLPQAAG